MVLGTADLPAGPLALETILRVPLVVVADPVVAASGPPATLDELAASTTARSTPEAQFPPDPAAPPGGGGGAGGAALLERPAGTILAFANPATGSGLFVWAGRTFLAVVADPAEDIRLAPVGELTVTSGRLVVGAPDVVAGWGADVDTGDGSPVRARMHRGRTRLGLIVVASTPAGRAPVTTAPGAVAVSHPAAAVGAAPLRLAG